MLANRLVKIAEDLQNEYHQFQLIQLLTAAIQLATDRPNLNATQYDTRRKDLRAKAEKIIAGTVFRTYPLDMLTLLSASDLFSILPANQAKLIITGFPQNMNLAISSAELQMALNQAQYVLGLLPSLITFSTRLGIHPIEAPIDRVIIDLKLPRSIFNNVASEFLTKLAQFIDFMKSATELSTGRRHDIELLAIASTDPVISCSLIPAAAWAVLKLYKAFLEVAEKQINVLKAIRELKNYGLPADKTASIAKEMEDVIRLAVSKAVDDALTRITSKVDDARRNEIRIEINKQAVTITTDIASGVRIYIGLEGQKDIAKMVQPGDEQSVAADEVINQIEEQRTLESKLDGIVEGSDQIRALIEHGR
jgi:hypothetical protein